MARPAIVRPIIEDALNTTREGLTVRELAALAEVSPQAVHKVLHQLGETVQVVGLDANRGQMMRMAKVPKRVAVSAKMPQVKDWPFQVGDVVRVRGVDWDDERGCQVVTLKGPGTTAYRLELR